jgi:AbrB family looped-hinge helix DNA binding protein
MQVRVLYEGMTVKEQTEYIMRMTRKGQVTIPVAIRNRLGLKPNEQVAFKVEAGEVKLQAAKATLEAVYGMVEPIQRPEVFEQLIEVAHEDQAQRVADNNA